MSGKKQQLSKKNQSKFLQQVLMDQTLNFWEVCYRHDLSFKHFENSLEEDEEFREELSLLIKSFYYGLLDQVHVYARGEESIMPSVPNLAAAKEMLKVLKSGVLTLPVEIGEPEEEPEEELVEEEPQEEGLSEEMRRRLGLT